MLLQITDLSFWYDPSDPPIVYGLSLAIANNEFVAIVGESGSGKSTLLRLMSGLMQAEGAAGRVKYQLSGTVIYEGNKVTSPLAAFGYVPQSFAAGLLPTHDARNNILVAVWEDGISEVERKMADSLMRTAGIIDVGHLNIRQLSGGQQQRVAICRALITQPRLLFMDEPFANLDPTLKPSMGELLRKLRKAQSLSVIMVTHDIEGALHLADRVIGIRPTYGTPEYHHWDLAKADRNNLRSEIEEWIAN